MSAKLTPTEFLNISQILAKFLHGARETAKEEITEEAAFVIAGLFAAKGRNPLELVTDKELAAIFIAAYTLGKVAGENRVGVTVDESGIN